MANHPVSFVVDVAKLRPRFLKRVDVNGPVPAHRPDLGPCHLWTGARHKISGYGILGIGRKTAYAHRVAFFLAHGRWPNPNALHRCDNPSCVRTDGHLFEGSQRDNVDDMLAKGRHAHGLAQSLVTRGEANAAAKLTEREVLEIRAAVAAGESRRAIARRTGLDRVTVGEIVARKTWRHI